MSDCNPHSNFSKGRIMRQDTNFQLILLPKIIQEEETYHSHPL
jgi:hypothetical protein